MQSLHLLLFVLFLVQAPPFKPKEEFQVNLDYEFRQRPGDSASKIRFDETRSDHQRNQSTAVLPYLKLRINILNAAGAVKARLEDNKSGNLSTKK
jgi:hypothetical protein